MAPDELIAGIERATKEACDRARDALRHVLTDTRVMEVLYRVISQRDLVARGISLAAEATEVLHVALWPEEFDELAEELCAAVMRGVKLALIVYGEHEATERLRSMGAGAVQHGESKHEAVPILGRQFVLVADRSRCITGSIFAPNHVEGVFTMNRGLVANAVDLVNHEIYVERILEEVGEPVWQRFGRHLEQLDSFDQPITNGHKRTK
jgi:sugar-specific transcriptional regulator TrmB